mgnify:CR=1 FL=1
MRFLCGLPPQSRELAHKLGGGVDFRPYVEEREDAHGEDEEQEDGAAPPGLDSAFLHLASLKEAMVKAVGRVKKLHDTRPPCTVDEKLSLCLSYLHCFRKGSLNTCRKILLRYTDLINKVVDLAPIQPFYQLISNLAWVSSEEEVNQVSAARENNPDYASVKKTVRCHFP